MRILFLGTSEFALPALKAIHSSEHRLLEVVCQPDSKKGRGQKLSFPPTKIWALEREVIVQQPEFLKNNVELQNQWASLAPDIAVVVSYGKILPKWVIDLPKHGCVNIHPSLLPQLRGAAPLQWSLIYGLKTSGVSLMQMDEGMDSGPILLQEQREIGEDETFAELHDRFAELGSQMVLKVLDGIELDGGMVSRAQDHDEATFAPMIEREHQRINWNNSAGQVHNQVRGLSPRPGAITYFRGKQLKILQTKLLRQDVAQVDVPGALRVEGNSIIVSCNDARLALLRLQPESKKTMSCVDFINGHRLKSGELFEATKN